LVGILFGFLLISTALQIGFMQWFRDLMIAEPAFASEPLNYMVGLVVLFAGLLMSFSSKIRLWFDILILGVMPFAFIGVCYTQNWLQFESKLNVSLSKGYQELAKTINEKYRQMPEVANYLSALYQSDTLTAEERTEKLKELQSKIVTMENDQKILDELKKQNISFKELLDYQAKNLEKQQWCLNARDTGTRVLSYTDAVKSDQPCVRDFALSLVKHEGAYYENSTGIPTKVGISQISDIHTYLSSKWQYVNDPVLLLSDYISPADRTIALGLKGDCDDFSVLMASSVEAIGGMTRIVHGECNGGGHAWCEVLIGGEEQVALAKKQLKAYFSEEQISDIQFSRGEENLYWLPLDWKIGNYTCNDGKTEIAYSPEEKMKKMVIKK
jgi:hypothetical protein